LAGGLPLASAGLALLTSGVSERRCRGLRDLDVWPRVAPPGGLPGAVGVAAAAGSGAAAVLHAGGRAADLEPVAAARMGAHRVRGLRRRGDLDVAGARSQAQAGRPERRRRVALTIVVALDVAGLDQRDH